MIFWEFSFICRHQRQRNTETMHTTHARMPRSHHYTYTPAPARTSSPARAACIDSRGIGLPLPTARTVPRLVPSGPAYITPDQLFILLSQGKGRRGLCRLYYPLHFIFFYLPFFSIHIFFLSFNSCPCIDSHGYRDLPPARFLAPSPPAPHTSQMSNFSFYFRKARGGGGFVALLLPSI